MSKSYALLRAGFPFYATLGMRRVTTMPMDLAISKDQTIYVLNRTDFMSEIRKINWKDEDLGTIPEGGKNLEWPVQILIDELDHIYISDEAKNKIIILDTSGKELDSWGEFGSTNGKINRPSGICFDKDNNIYIVDTYNHRISKFTKSGTFISSFGENGSQKGQLNYPWGIDIDHNTGDLLVSDWGNDRIQKFDYKEKFIESFELNNDLVGKLDGPAGIAVDSHSDIFVADRGNHRIIQFNHKGNYVERFIGDAVLSKIGRTYLMANARALRAREMTALEETKRFRGPTSVRIYGDLMYIPDFGSHRIQVYKKEAYELNETNILPDTDIPFLYNV